MRAEVSQRRPIGWWAAAQKSFRKFPIEAQEQCATALAIIADGGKPAIAKPLLGLGSGVMEIALAYRGDAFRVVYALQLGQEIWVVHAFQKKSTQGFKTSQRDIELIRARIRWIKEQQTS